MSETTLTKENINSVSVVIPTLGGETLRGTIEQLNRGALVPAEILVCIPEEDAFRVKGLSFANVRVVKTHCRGQVAQRAIGFQQVQHPMVLQLDDDILLKEEALQELVCALCELGHGNALSPVYNHAMTGRCIHKMSEGFVGFFKSLYAYVVCGAPWGIKRMGVVTAIGVNYGVDSSYCDAKPFETQWLPGGCVLCFREELIKENFFPYIGKAYCEDIIHSFLRTENGMRLWVIPKAYCLINVPDYDINRSSIDARRYFVRISGGPKWRLTLYNIFSRLKQGVSNK